MLSLLLKDIIFLLRLSASKFLSPTATPSKKVAKVPDYYYDDYYYDYEPLPPPKFEKNRRQGSTNTAGGGKIFKCLSFVTFI